MIDRRSNHRESVGSDSACPVCSGSSWEHLFTVASAPVSCGQLFPSAEAAVQAGQCRLEVSICPTCGHVWNAAHRGNPDSLYNENYYASFTASSQARDYQMALARDLGRIVRVSGKTVLEIGCGDGFFLKSLGSLGARSIGFEPSSTFDVAVRQPGIKVYNEYFPFEGTQRVDFQVDIVVLRHVLEHLASPRKVLDSLKDACFSEPPPQFLFLEVPNVFQLLKDNLYFDFYNDHINYFSYHSLERLLHAAGWVPIARIGKDDEFIRLVAGNSAYEPAPWLPPEEAGWPDTKDEVISAASMFRTNYQEWKAKLAAVLTAQREKGGRIAVWGAGSRGVALLSGLELDRGSFAYVVDSDSNKHGRYLPIVHLPIYPVEHLKIDPVDSVIVTSYTYFDEILSQLDWFQSAGGKVIKVYPMPKLVP